MEDLKFKTNIKCSGCVEKVSEVLNEKLGANHWKVDISNPEKLLTVTGKQAEEAFIVKWINAAGFVAEPLN